MKPKLFLMGLILVCLGGCNLLPEPSSLIQSPQITSEGLKDMEEAARKLLPKGTIPLVPNLPTGSQSVLTSDLNGDEMLESIVFYQSTNQSAEIGTIVMTQKGEQLEKVFMKQGTGYEMSWGSTTDVTGDGQDELLIGWKMGTLAGNILEVYTWEKDKLKLLDKINYHEIEVIRSTTDKAYRLAVWKKDVDDIYAVSILKWNQNQFVPDQKLSTYYYSKVSDYYKDRTMSVPDKSQYWYYLADAYLKQNHPGEAMIAINQGMKRKVVSPSFQDFENLKASIEKNLANNKSPLIYQLPEAAMKINIPRDIASYINIETENGPATNVIVTVNFWSESVQNVPLFMIEVYSKEMVHEEIPLQKITESGEFIYYLKDAVENKSLRVSDLNYENALLQKEQLISSVLPDTTETVIKSIEEEHVIKALTDAVNRYWYVTSGGKLEGEIESFRMGEQEYRYMGTDLDTKEKLEEYLKESFTPDAITSYINRAKIIEHKGRLAQPNADGGSLLAYQDARIQKVKGDTNEREYDIKVPLGTSLVSEFIHVQFQKTESGWKISSEPGTF